MPATSPGGEQRPVFSARQEVSSQSPSSYERLPSLSRIPRADEVIKVLRVTETVKGAVYFDVTSRATKGRYARPDNVNRERLESSRHRSSALQKLAPPPELLQRFVQDVIDTDSAELYHLLHHSCSRASSAKSRRGMSGAANSRPSTTCSHRLSATAPPRMRPEEAVLPASPRPGLRHRPHTSQASATNRRTGSAASTRWPQASAGAVYEHRLPSPNRRISTATTTLTAPGLGPLEENMSPRAVLETRTKFGSDFDSDKDEEPPGDLDCTAPTPLDLSRLNTPTLTPTHSSFLKTLLQPPAPPSPLSPQQLECQLMSLHRMTPSHAAAPHTHSRHTTASARPMTSSAVAAGCAAATTTPVRSRSATLLRVREYGMRATSVSPARTTRPRTGAAMSSGAGDMGRPAPGGSSPGMIWRDVTGRPRAVDPAEPGTLNQVLEISDALQHMGVDWAAYSHREAEEVVRIHEDIEVRMKAVHEEIKKTAERLREEKELKAALEARKHRGVMTKGVATFVHFYDEKMWGFMAWGMARWKRALASFEAKLRNDAAVIVTRAVRGFYCRQLAKRMRMQLAMQRQQQASRLLVRLKLRHVSALDIQRVWRGYIKGRKLLAQKRQEIRAARVIQRTHHRAQAKRAAWLYIQAFEHKDVLVTRIQSAYRGYRARKHYRRLREHRRHLEIESRLAVYPAQVNTNFTLKGAAIRIQKAWRRSHWRMRVLVQQNRARRYQASLIIQGFSRIIHAKKRAGLLRTHYQGFHNRCRVCMILNIRVALWIAARQKAKKAPALVPPKSPFAFTSMQITSALPIESSQPPAPSSLWSTPGTPQGSRLSISVASLPRPTSTPRPFVTIPVTPTPASALASATAAAAALTPSFLASTGRKVGRKIHRSLLAATYELDSLLSPQRAKQRRMERQAAVRIAVVARRFLARRRARVRREYHPDLVAHKILFIQRCYRGYRIRRERRIVIAKVKRIQRFYRRSMARHKAKQAGAIRIQHAWRAYLRRKEAAARRAVLGYVIMATQRLARGYLAKRHVAMRRVVATRRREICLVGRAEHAALVETERKRQILWFSSIPDVQAMGELQHIFLYFTSAKGRYDLQDKDQQSSPLTLDSQRFAKLCSSIPGLTSKDFSARSAEMIGDNVMKACGKKALGYGAFVEAMKKVADGRFKKTNALGRFRGTDARFIKLNLEVIYNAATVKRILERMPKEDTFPHRATAKILSDALTIQRVYRGWKGRQRAARRRRDAKDELEHRRLSRAATRIQTRWRKHRAKYLMSVAASQVYEKCVDPDTKQSYYLNPRTGKATWDKPKLLHSLTLKNPILLPDPDRDFSILCDVCDRAVARRWCMDCSEYFCLRDYLASHKKGKAAGHRTFAMDLCVQCNVQIASRHCQRCDDDYCCTCFNSLHRRGQLQLHFALPMTDMCGVCTRWMALKTCETCQTHLCRTCARYDHEAQGHAVREYDYKPKAVQEFLVEEARVKEQEMIVTTYQNRMEYLREERRQKAAIKIQSLYRGYRARCSCMVLSGGRGASREEMRQHRRADDRIRKQLVYQLRDVIGKAPELTTDGPRDRVLKKYPIWVRPLVVEAVDGDWITALKMTQEQEEFLATKRKKKEPALMKMKATLDDQLQHAKLSMALNTLALKLEANEAMLRDAQAALKEARGPAAKEGCRKLVKQVKMAIDVNVQNMQDTKKAMGALVHRQQQRQGPDRLNKVITAFQHRGRPMPFTVHAKQGHAFFKCDTGLAQKLQRGEVYWIGKKVEQAQQFRVRDVVTRTRTVGKEKVVECLVFTDRDWTEPDERDLPVAKLPRPLPYAKPLVWLLYQLDASPIVQLPLKLFITMTRQAATSIGSVAANFDEESPNAIRLNRQVSALLRVEGRAMRHRYHYIRMQTNKVGILATTRAVIAKSVAMMRAADAWVKKMQEEMKKKDPYVLWELSDEKETLLVVWKAEGAQEETMGAVTVDQDMPLPILREKIRRRLREPLNKKNGGGFLFMNVAKGQPLSMYYEGKKRGRDMVDKRVVDEVTKQCELVVTLTLDSESSFQEIPSIPDIVLTEEELHPQKRKGSRRSSIKLPAPVVNHEDTWSVFDSQDRA